jgi:hypothetical protein
MCAPFIKLVSFQKKLVSVAAAFTDNPEGLLACADHFS